MKTTLPLILLTGIVLLAYSGKDSEGQSAAGAETADTVYINGKIYTVNEGRPWAEAVAIKGGKFIAVGSADDVKKVTGDQTKVVDLKGNFAMPGIHDTHVHIEQAYIPEAVGEMMLNFSADQSIEEMQQALKEYAAKNPDLEVLFAGSLPQAKFPNSSPTKAFIDDVISDRPVFMLSDTEHEGLLNSKALEMEAIAADTPSPKGGTIDKDPETGEPTGYLRETAAGKWAWKHFPKVSEEEHKKGLQATIAYLNSIGITSVKQQHAKNPIAMAAQALEKEGKLDARVALSWTWKGPLEPMPLPEQEKMIAERKRFASDLIKTEFIKLSVDGNAGSTGYVLEPYLITKDTGLPVFPKDEDLFAEVERLDRMGLSITSHCTGDAANRQMIDAVAKVKKKHGTVKGRHQLAHATLIHPVDIPRLKALDITPEFSPVIWYPGGFPNAQRNQLGKRMLRWYPMRSVSKSGARFAIASDGPLFWHEPMQLLETAITRQKPGGGDEALAPHEGLDLKTAIKGVTMNSAYLMDQEANVGSIEEGKQADMIVIDKNLFEIPSTQIGTAKVLLTIFQGKVVYDAATGHASEEAIEERFDVELDFSGDAGYRGCRGCRMPANQ